MDKKIVLPIIGAELILCVFPSAYGGDVHARTRIITPESVGALPVSNPDLFPEYYRSVVRAVVKKLRDEAEVPASFCAEIEPGEDPHTLVIHLWHKSAFERQHGNVLGNPGGRCRDFYFDTEKQKIMRTLFWK